MTGKTISHFRVLDQLGGGGMGVVYLAEDTRLDRKVALKFLHAPRLSDPTANARFVQEAKAASALDHRNICTVHEIGDCDDGQIFIAMSFYDGQLLKAKIDGGPLQIDQAVNYALQVAEGLDVAHEAGIIHRDIKPGNLMVTSRDVVKILDFGLAKMSDATFTAAGVAVGTVAYMSPEQVRGERVGHGSDIWSLGVVLYEMITGVRPFEAAYETATFYAILNVDPKLPQEYNDDVPEQLQRVVLRCLEKDAAKRYDSAGALADDLRRIGSGESIRATDESIARPVRGRLSPRAMIAAALTGLAVILLAVGPIRRAVFSLPQPLREHLSLAVLPFTVEPADPDDAALSEGFAHYLGRLLMDLERFHQPLWTAPYREIAFFGNKTSQEVAGQVFVDMTLRPRFSVDADLMEVELVLEEARTGDILRRERVAGRWSNLSQFQVRLISALTALLDIRLTDQQLQTIVGGGTVDTTAFRATLVGLGYLRRYQLARNRERALEQFTTAVSTDTNYVMGHALLASASITQFGYARSEIGYDRAKHLLSKALVHTDKAASLDSLSASIQVLRGIILSQLDRLTEAEDAYRLALELDPRNRDAYKYLAEFLEAQNRIDEAEQVLADATEVNPFYWYSHYRLGQFYGRQLRHQDAIAQFDRVVETVKDNAWGYLSLASQYLELDNFATAESLLVKATTANIHASDARARAFYKVGEIRYRHDDFVTAADQVRKALEIDDSYYTAWSLLGDASHWLGDTAQAQRSWRRVIDLVDEDLAINPGLQSELVMKALTQAKLGLRSGARSTIEEILSQPRLPDGVRVSVGTALEILGMRAQALELIKTAVRNGYNRETIEAIRWLDSFTQDRRYVCLFEGAPCEM